jgi:Ca2+-binding EF-hand superfamily protein
MQILKELFNQEDPSGQGIISYNSLYYIFSKPLKLAPSEAKTLAGYGLQSAKMDDGVHLRWKLLLTNLEQCFRVRI